MPTPARTRRFDAILLDFAGVFTTSPFAALRSKGDDTGHGFETVMNVVMGPYDEDTDHPWHRVERGELELREAFALITEEAAKIGLSFDGARMGSFFGPASVQEVVVDWVLAHRASGYRTALVTNNVRELRQLWEPLIPVAELFDVVIDSSAVGVRKPDPRIFEITLERLGVSADRAVFVDDWPGNVAAAKAIGIAGVVMGDDPLEGLTALDLLLAGGS